MARIPCTASWWWQKGSTEHRAQVLPRSTSLTSSHLCPLFCCGHLSQSQGWPVPFMTLEWFSYHKYATASVAPPCSCFLSGITILVALLLWRTTHHFQQGCFCEYGTAVDIWSSFCMFFLWFRFFKIIINFAKCQYRFSSLLETL